jgi:F0F1-type ATP synthase membrane subunit b/b'
MFITVIAQNNKKESDVEKLRIELNDNLKSLNNKVNELSVDFNSQKYSLESKVNDASNTINYLNSVVDSFGLILTVLVIFIAIFSLILPILAYQYGIKPSRQALKELDNKIANQVEKYFEDTRKNSIDYALKNIRDGNTELKNQGLSIITSTQHEGLSDEQMGGIYLIFRKETADQATRGKLAFILSSRVNEYATALFNSKQVIDDPVNIQIALSYYPKIGLNNSYEGINNILQIEKYQYINFISLIHNFQQYESGNIVELFNDSIIVDLLTVDTLTKIKSDLQATSDLQAILKSLNSDELTDIEESYLYKKIRSA